MYAYNNVFMTVVPLLVIDGGGTVAQSGLQAAVFLVVAVALRFLFGPLADVRGTKLVMVVGAAAFAGAAFLFALCTEFWQLLAVRCLQAVGLAAFFPCATSSVASLAPGGKAGSYLGAYRFVTALSLLVGPPSAFALLAAAGYEALFAVSGVVGVAAVVALLAVDLPAHAKRSPARSGALQTMGEAVRAKSGVLAVALGATFVVAAGYGLLLNFSAQAIETMLPGSNAGLYFSLVSIGSLAANPLVGWLFDRMNGAALVAACMAVMGAGIAVFGFAGASPVVLCASGVAAGFGYAGCITAVLSLIATRVGKEVRASALALQQNGIDLGIAAGGALFGAVLSIVSASWTAFAAQGILTMVCAVAVALVGYTSSNKA